MARTDTLGNFLTDVADAIRTKKGTSETIPAKDFDTEIENLPSGGDYNVKVDTSKTYNLNGGLKSFITKIDNIDISGRKDISMMFQWCINLQEIPLLDTSSATDVANLFGYCQSITSIPLLNTSNATNMTGMFSHCIGLTTIPNIDTSSATSTSSMFTGCINILSIPPLDLGKSTNLYGMFEKCSKLTSITFNNSSICKPTNVNSMFNYCNLLTYIDLRDFDFSNATNYNNMFGYASGGVPNDCEIIVADDTAKTWINTNFSRLTNVKTVAEYEAEQGE